MHYVILLYNKYACNFTPKRDGKNIEIIHTKFLRKILCVRKSTNLTALYGELGRMPMHIMQQINMIKYWLKISALEDNNIVKRMYNMLKDDVENGKT